MVDAPKHCGTPLVSRGEVPECPQKLPRVLRQPAGS